MLCPFCQCHESTVKYVLHVDSQFSTIRRRECLYCHKRYTTCETIKKSKNYESKKHRTAYK